MTEITADEWDSLQSLLCDDVSIKTDLSSPVSELDCSALPGVVVQPVSANVISVPMTASVVNSKAAGTVGIVSDSAPDFNVVLNSKVKIRPKPLSLLATSTSLPTSQTGVFSLDNT